MTERLRVQILARVGEKFSSPELALCADSYSVSVPPQCYCSGTQKTPVILPKSAGGRLYLNMHTSLTQRSWSGLTMPLSRHIVGTYLETAHTQLVTEHSATVVSAR